MLYRLRQRSGDESGFTLIELLVVILIIGILAAIAIPAFLNQKGKANDASAKVQVRTAQTAAETYATDHNGAYTGMEIKELEKIEPTLAEAKAAKLTVVKVGETEYVLTSKVEQGTTKNEFTITRESGGGIKRTCVKVGTGACPASGEW
jgi:type IV pilus assembly protein PilA